MQAQIDTLKKEIEELNERIEELEAQLNDIDYSITENETILEEVKNVLEFSFLDNLPERTEENVIILHSNPYRTYNLVNSCKPSSGIKTELHKMNKIYLTPEHFKEILSNAQKGSYIMLKSEVFEFSDEFENLVLDAIGQNVIFFIILTNDLNKIPQNIREKMSIIQ